MSTPTWQYIAGFFDGEGCIRRTNKTTVAGGRLCMGNPAVSITQASRPDRVLKHISGFLHRHQIVNYIGKERQGHPKWKPIGVLQICARPCVSKFLRKVLPYLIVKRKRALEELEYIKSRTWRRYVIPQDLALKAIEAYSTGMTLRQVSARFHIDMHSITKYIRLYGKKTRNKSESMKLSLSKKSKEWLSKRTKKAWRNRRKKAKGNLGR